ncbi:MAG: adenosylmethionine--8-amino-7-oxononanoate transaminase [Verrucomicrobia bacterium]|nr:adenosylmethionine--8-amino-7-oxononanoate transaminase [Verrucomicrobiota bacterium]
MHPVARLDLKHVWHPFTQMRDWLKREPIVLERAKGAVLWDVRGRQYLDANSSIWTNLHGHRHPRLDQALHRQLRKVAHTSALGFANVPASHLAASLSRTANPLRRPGGRLSGSKLSKVFFSDDGSTAMEAALKMAHEHGRRALGLKRPRFLSLQGSYHGDTIGAVSLGHIDLFHAAYSPLLFRSEKVMAPYCYRCPFNRARPERGDARTYRKCQWECVDKVEAVFASAQKAGQPISAFSVEPRMQGAAGMIAQPSGWLPKAAEIARHFKALLIADEVMTGMGRCGDAARGKLFACQAERVSPDLMAIAKGLTGGYLPMAATLATQEIFDVFLGEYEEFRTFFHGHSFTANQLGAAVALENLNLLESPAGRKQRANLEGWIRQEVEELWSLEIVGDIRQAGLAVGVELVRDWRTRKPFALREKVGIRVCEEMARRGVLTRPIGSVVVMMPPFCTTRDQLRTMFTALRESALHLSRSCGLTLK